MQCDLRLADGIKAVKESDLAQNEPQPRIMGSAAVSLTVNKV